jgi:uncharacterized protein YggE
MLKKTFYTILIVFLILLSLLIIGGITFGGYYAYQSTKPLSILNTSSTLKEKIKPNKATTVASLEIKQDDSTEKKNILNILNKEADEKTILVLKSMTKAGIESKNIKTNKYSTKDYSYGYNPDPTKVIEPKDMVVVDFTITFENLDNYPKKPNEILDGLINNGITRYNPLNYEIANQETVCEKIESQALAKVSEKVRNQIKELGGKIVKIEPNITQSCMNNGYGYPIPMTAYKDATAATQSSTPSFPDVQTGEIELTVVATAKAEYR